MNINLNINSDQYLISRKDSTALKGLLIGLIVLGHLRGLPNFFQMYIYCFHVQCFFILPFLYPSKPLTKNNVVNLALKLYWPFILFYFILILIFTYVFHDSAFLKPDDLIPGINNIVLGIWSFITGGIKLIDEFSGTQFLWFLPVFFSMTVFRMWYRKHSLKNYQKIILFALGSVAYIIYATLTYLNMTVPDKFIMIFQALSPFSIWQALGFFILGSSTLFFIRRLSFRNSSYYLILFFIFTGIYFLFAHIDIVFKTLRIVFPIIFFLTIYCIRELFGKINLLQKIGNRSLSIYLIHPFLCIIAGFIIPPDIIDNFFILCLQFIIILAVTYFLSIFIEKIPMLRIILFPNGEEIGLSSSQKNLNKN